MASLDFVSARRVELRSAARGMRGYAFSACWALSSFFIDRGRSMVTADRPQCPECDTAMVRAPRPLMRIFGDVRAFECSTCNYMILLQHPFQPVPSEPGIVSRLDAAE